jgi:uncharacterized delta-60 repeat protein
MKRFGILLSLLSFFYLLVMPSQVLADKFAKTFGDTLDQRAYCVQQTSDSGYIVAGSGPLFYAGDYDFLVLKLNSAGAIAWLRAYGTTSHDAMVDHGRIQQTSDGGYILAGYTSTAGVGYTGSLVIKLNATGVLEWAKTFFTPGTGIENAYGIQQTLDGGYIVAGYTGPLFVPDDFFVLKLNSSGDLVWSKTYGGSGADVPCGIQQTSDGGYIVAGYTESFGAGSRDFLVLKLDSAGAVQWAKTYGGSGYDHLYSIQQTSDGGYIVAGDTKSYGAGSSDILVVKLNSTGDLEWAKTYGGTSSDDAYSIQQTSEGGYIVAGITLSYGAYDVLIIKLNSIGDLEWARTFGDSYWNEVNGIRQTSDNGYILAGTTERENYVYAFLAIKLESDGVYEDCFYDCSLTVNDCSPDISSPSVVDSNWATNVGSPSLSVSNLTYSVDDVCPPVVAVGEDVGGDTPESIYLDIIPSVGKNNFSIKYGIPKSVDVSNEPTLSLKLYDATGRLEKVLLEKNIRCWCQAGSYTRSLDLSELQSGVYFLRLEVGNKYSVKKAILLR